MNAVIVNAQGFTCLDNEFVVKEFSVITLNNFQEISCEQSILFQPPTNFSSLTSDYQKQVAWDTHYIHGIDWKCGEVAYDQMEEVISNAIQNVIYVYVGDCLQKNFFSKFLTLNQVIIDISIFGYGTSGITSAYKLEYCQYHKKHLENISNEQSIDHLFQTNYKYCKKHLHFEEYNFPYDCARLAVQLQWFYIDKFINLTSIQNFLSLMYLDLGSITQMETDDILKLGFQTVLKNAFNEIDYIWDKLPFTWKHHPLMIGYKRCFEHFHKDSIEAFKFKKDCIMCNNS